MSDNHSIRATSNSSSVDRWLAYAVFRFTLGINILVHGVDRVFGVGARGFAAKTSSEFAGTALPHFLVFSFLVFLPFAEAVLGALIIFGLLTRWTLTLGALLIAVLVFGTALRSDWATAGCRCFTRSLTTSYSKTCRIIICPWIPCSRHIASV
jgi:thiosulfate dehydrogenase [quinone] large subunit